MSKIELGEFVQKKNKHPMAGLVGVIIKHNEENHTYLVRLSQDHELLLHEDEIEIKKA
ncbi:hypothetical protein P7D85_15850 [Enterococcus hulanensis]|uniref:DUF2187 domain-containing protein n=1 Tax=Enterococcus hulanensis TaxID=2559929 RepID=A0ABU3F2X5_9ENTE|nr:hypothetical protein [Enterococcus hulanensis]MDT2601262.1 hypothetical protein [Enterococcus hulanensis]MDT2610828.1 hypothetical protein [Enterococcus hulanensis]MDT2618233.1 hypothetical protein [Enterococcus hulanensis]MDT2629197.1 hypothetical protein [Enterococcus hulanensis]MDT2656798.1 hypothetical protein [Enterococcus hulanensis]